MPRNPGYWAPTKCRKCESEFVRSVKGQQYCVRCRNGEFIRKYTKICKQCHTLFTTTSLRQRKYCNKCSRGERNRDSIPPKLRFQILLEAEFRCRYCGAAAPSVKLHIDHIVPFAKGGLTEKNNLVVACEQCNLGKRDFFPTVDSVLKPA